MDSVWTVERHLRGKRPEVIALSHRFIELAQACGPFTYAVSKSAITLKGTRRGYAGAIPGERALKGYLTSPVRPGQLRLVISRAKGRNRITVSVFVIVRCTVSDLGKALEWGQANGDIAEEITAYGKSLGQLGHRMLTDGKDIVVIDEWPDADAFNKFFAGAARMGEFLSGAGVVGEPEVTVLDAVDMAGQF